MNFYGQFHQFHFLSEKEQGKVFCLGLRKKKNKTKLNPYLWNNLYFVPMIRIWNSDFLLSERCVLTYL